MREEDTFNSVAFLVMMAVITLQFILNFFAYRKQKEIERFIDKNDVPEALRDRAEVTFWQTISSAMLLIVGINSLFVLGIERHILLILFYVALAVKTIPSARWLWRYYRGRFDDTRPKRPTS